MNTINQMKNMVILRNLPSNIIEEAFVVLKPNKKIKILNTTENKEENEKAEEKTGEYIIKEAEMVINNYITDVEKENQIKSDTIKEIEHKYKRLKKINTFILLIFAISMFINLIIK